MKTGLLDCRKKTSEYEQENEKYLQELKDKRLRCNTLEREYADATEKLRITRREADAAKSEAQNMIVVMESLEKKEKTVSCS